jgi:predicted regulator of Ras-like GTPase activity (Roadblock/LC7/MglB family)
VSASDDTLAARLAPYRATAGMIAALLVSRDGFVVAADAEDGFATEAVAAQVAGVIDVGARLATELGEAAAKYITVELEGRNVVLAPFGNELMLVLVGTPEALSCDYHLGRPGG